MTSTTVIIKTIGRRSLKAAIRSAKSEGFKVIVVSDGAKVSAHGARYIKLGKKWGYYGGMAANVGAAVAESEFITFLDDDDVFVKGAGDKIRKKLQECPDVDIWIGGLLFDQVVSIHSQGKTVYKGHELCMNGDLGLQLGNVAMPTYRTSIFSKVPFTDTMPENQTEMIDIAHVQLCSARGYKIDWFGDLIYQVRPSAGKANGRGEF